MQVKETKAKGLVREYEVKIPAATIAEKLSARLMEIGKTVKIQGFRPGKAPLNILNQRYGEDARREVMNSLINESWQQVMKDKGVRPAIQPTVEGDDYKEDKDLTYTMSVEILPEIKIPDFKKIKLEKQVAKIESKEVEEALENIAKSNRGSKVVKRAAKKGDIVAIDFEGSIDGVPFDGGKADNHFLELGSNSFIPGFEDQLIGTKAGDEKDVNVAFPKEYGAQDLAGKDAVFKVKVNEVREYEDAKIDDELAKNLGMEDEKSLRKLVEERLQGEFESVSRTRLKRELFDLLDKDVKFDLPPTLVKAEAEGILHQMTPQEPGKKADHDENAWEDYKELAERRVKLGLMLAEVGQEQNIQITDQELRMGLLQEAQRYPGQEQQVFEFYQNNPQALENVRAPLFEEKVVDHIFGVAEIKEKTVSKEDLMAVEDDEELLKPKSEKKKTAAKKKPAAKTKKEPAKKDADKAKKPAAKKKAPAKKAAKK